MEILRPWASLWLLALHITLVLGVDNPQLNAIEDNSRIPTSINEDVLATVLKHVKRGMSGSSQFAIAILLPREACQNHDIAESQGATIEKKLLHDQHTRLIDNALFVSEDNFLVASVRKGERRSWHAEAVLVGTMEGPGKWWNELDAFLKGRSERYPPDSSCFIFFSLLSPCLDYCLNPDSPIFIVPELQRSLQHFNSHFQAFAFEHAYEEDQRKGQHKVWMAWRQIPMPLFRCFFDTPPSCVRCTGELNADECLAEMPPYPPDY